MRRLATRRVPTRLLRIRLLAIGLLLACCGCAVLGGSGSAHEDLRILVPNAPGGGYDTTARIAARVLEDEGITDRIDIFNVEGASGVVGLTRIAHERGNPDLLMMMGLGVVGAVYANDAPVDLDDVTPIARLLSEPEIIVVPTRSRLHTLQDLLDTWRRHPARVVVGGGSARGGPDFLATHLLAKAVGIEPTRVDYRQYDGGGPLLAALLDKEVDFAVTGVGESADQMQSGPVRVLAVTGGDRVADIDAPTLREQGVDLDFVNWRGFVAPPGLSAHQRKELEALAVAMHDSTAWARAARDNGWTDTFEVGRPFADFLTAESRRVAAVMTDLGFATSRQRQVSP